ncbi:MAG: hypothetical protein ABSD42_05135 [Candidatus Bathyarchaeia archaeon]
MRQKNNFENAALPLPPPPPVEKRNMKVVSLAIICVLLAASLVGVIAFYMPNANNSDLKAQITEKDNSINALEQNITNLQDQLSTINASNYAGKIAALEQDLSEANATANAANATANAIIASWHNVAIMNSSESLVSQKAIPQGHNTWAVAFNDTLSYAGYIAVQATSTSNTTYVQTIWSSNGIKFDQNITLAKSGTATFPVLSGKVGVRIGNTDQTDTVNNSTLTITYHY